MYFFQCMGLVMSIHRINWRVPANASKNQQHGYKDTWTCCINWASCTRTCADI